MGRMKTNRMKNTLHLCIKLTLQQKHFEIKIKFMPSFLYKIIQNIFTAQTEYIKYYYLYS